MKVIILAGGFGTRLARVSGDKPKPLVEVAGVPILERQIRFLLSHGFDDIRLSLHHKADQIIAFCDAKWPGKFEYIVEPVPLGTGGGIRFAAHGIREPFLAINGDILTDLDPVSFTAAKPSTIVAAYQEDVRPYGFLEIENSKVTGFREKTQELRGGYINAGWYVLHPDVFTDMTEDKFMMETDVFPRLVAAGELGAHIHHGYWIDCGTEERLAQAHKDHS